MNQVKKAIPHLLTLSNMTLGTLALVFLLVDQNLEAVLWCVGIAAVLDVFDGAAARALGVSGPLGKELDSLADVVSFGVVPALVLAWVGTGFGPGWLAEPAGWGPLLIAPASALRLARFNLDEEQATYFKGLPTPANALFVLLWAYAAAEVSWLQEPMLVAGVGVLSALALNSPFPLLSLKGLKEKARLWLGLVGLWIAFFVLLGTTALPFLVPLYFVYSILFFKPRSHEIPR